MYQRIAARFKDIILVIEIRDDEDGLGRTALRGWWGECLGRHRGGLLTQLQQDGDNKYRRHRESMPQDHSSHLGAPSPQFFFRDGLHLKGNPPDGKS